MSIYNPPSKTQGIFNPSNYGGLGTGGEITIDYLDANYLSFPVAQGNTTLVGTSVFGNITQQGNFSTTGELIVNDVNVITKIGTKQDTIGNDDLTIANTSGLQSALNGKQDTIGNDDLTIAFTSGLQSALNGKQDTIGNDDLTIANTSGLQTALDAKQDEIDINTNLSLNSITLNDLIVNSNLNMDNEITFQAGVFNEASVFNTLVIRRFDESTDVNLNLNELQIWVNDVNILPSNISTLNAYFANWSDKDTPLPARTIEGVVRDVNPFLFDETILFAVESSAEAPVNAVVIKNIPSTLVNDIQAVVLYHRGGDGNVPRALGLTIELYNSIDDPTLLSTLATTPVIERGVRRYRYNFPSIDTYTLGFSTGDSITQIPADFEDLTTTTTTITENATKTKPIGELNINAKTSITGGLTSDTITLPTIGDVESTIQGKQTKLTAGTNISIDPLTNEISASGGGGTTIDNTTDLDVNTLTSVGNISVGGNASITGNLTTPNRVRFSAYRSATELYNSPPSDVVYNIASYNVGSAYNTTTGIFTAPIAGAYFFTASFYSVNNTFHEVQFTKNENVIVDVIRIGITTFGVSKNNGVCQVYLAIGDTLKLEHTQGSIQLIGSPSAINVFTGYLIG